MIADVNPVTFIKGVVDVLKSRSCHRSIPSHPDWVDVPGLKSVLGIDDLAIVPSITKIEVVDITGTIEDFNGQFKIQFAVPRTAKIEVVDATGTVEDFNDQFKVQFATFCTYTFAELASIYGNLPRLFLKLYSIANNNQCWSSIEDVFGPLEFYESHPLYSIPSPEADPRCLPAGAVVAFTESFAKYLADDPDDTTEVKLVDYVLTNVLNLCYESEHYNTWGFMNHDGCTYIVFTDYYRGIGYIPMDEFIKSPLTRGVNKLGQFNAPTLHGVVYRT